MAPEVQQIHREMDRPHHHREAGADAHARAHVASLATALGSIKRVGHAHSDVAVKGAEGTSSSSSSSLLLAMVAVLAVRAPVVHPSDVIIPVM